MKIVKKNRCIFQEDEIDQSTGRSAPKLLGHNETTSGDGNNETTAGTSSKVSRIFFFSVFVFR